MIGWLAYGDPSWTRFADSRFDFSPLVVAGVALFLLRALLGVRLDWRVAVVALFLAPLFMAVASRIGLPLASLAALLAATILTTSIRRIRRSG